jgi:hypothetical protein
MLPLVELSPANADRPKYAFVKRYELSGIVQLQCPASNRGSPINCANMPLNAGPSTESLVYVVKLYSCVRAALIIPATKAQNPPNNLDFALLVPSPEFLPSI